MINTRRLEALEAAEQDRIAALSDRDFIDQGNLAPVLDNLSPAQCAELVGLLEASFDHGGDVDHERLTPAQRERALRLLYAAVPDESRRFVAAERPDHAQYLPDADETEETIDEH